MQLKGFLVVLSGPSGAGKNTLMNTVFPSIPELHYSVSVTTRPPRVGEKDGIDYFFVNDARFDEMIVQGELLEWAEFCEYRYGTPLSFVQEKIENGQTVIMDVDIQGARQIRERMDEVVSVFLLPPTWEELRRRLQLRGKDSQEVISRRLRKSFDELKHIVDYDYFIINDNLESAAERLRSIIKAEMCRVQRVEPRILQEMWQRGINNEADCC